MNTWFEVCIFRRLAKTGYQSLGGSGWGITGLRPDAFYLTGGFDFSERQTFVLAALHTREPIIMARS